jgi:hypothetical protein
MDENLYWEGTFEGAKGLAAGFDCVSTEVETKAVVSEELVRLLHAERRSRGSDEPWTYPAGEWRQSE